MNKLYTLNEASNITGVSKSTLRRWEKEGKLKSKRTHGGHRRYSYLDLSEFISDKILEQGRIIIGYCRVSSNCQKDDLVRQVENVSNYCIAKGYSFKIIQDIGSGINYNKKGLKQLIALVQKNQVDKIVLNYKDRFLRFGFELLETMFQFHDTTFEIINHTEDKTYEQELVEDMLSIITVFSARLYGSRSHKKKQIEQENKKLFTLKEK